MGMKREIWITVSWQEPQAGLPTVLPRPYFWPQPFLGIPPFYPCQDHRINAAPPSCAFPVMQSMTQTSHTFPFYTIPSDQLTGSFLFQKDACCSSRIQPCGSYFSSLSLPSSVPLGKWLKRHELQCLCPSYGLDDGSIYLTELIWRLN